MTPEIRSIGEAVRRAEGDSPSRAIVGHAAVFNREANIAGVFIERIAPGAFAAAIKRDDVRCLFNHGRDFVIGRNTAGTLRLAEDDKGLAYEADPPDTTWARDLVVSIDRGDINQSSFSFRALKQEWDESGELPIRTVLEVELFDVSPVTYPAYDDATAGLRSATAVLVEARSAGLIRSPSLVTNAVRSLRAKVDLDLRARTASRL